MTDLWWLRHTVLPSFYTRRNNFPELWNSVSPPSNSSRTETFFLVVPTDKDPSPRTGPPDITLHTSPVWEQRHPLLDTLSTRAVGGLDWHVSASSAASLRLHQDPAVANHERFFSEAFASQELGGQLWLATVQELFFIQHQNGIRRGASQVRVADVTCST